MHIIGLKTDAIHREINGSKILILICLNLTAIKRESLEPFKASSPKHTLISQSFNITLNPEFTNHYYYNPLYNNIIRPNPNN